jgi:hypothetical protein
MPLSRRDLLTTSLAAASPETPFGYTLVDLFDDGTVERQYIPYGWQAT